MSCDMLTAVWPWWRDEGHGGENDVWPKTERNGIAYLWRTKETGCFKKVSSQAYFNKKSIVKWLTMYETIKILSM